jgi:hypothetical protein
MFLFVELLSSLTENVNEAIKKRATAAAAVDNSSMTPTIPGTPLVFFTQCLPHPGGWPANRIVR